MFKTRNFQEVLFFTVEREAKHKTRLSLSEMIFFIGIKFGTEYCLIKLSFTKFPP